jgi:hypothetical protein
MRALSFACLLLTLAAPAMAQDRYGPQSAARAAAITYAPVAHLNWPGKVQAAAPQAAAQEPVRPLTDGVLRHTSAYGAPPPVAPATPPAIANAGPPAAENAPWRRLTGGSSAPRPTTAPAAMEAAAPPALATTPVATSVAAPAAPRPDAAAGEQARYYSLHREYGETPDAIPAPDKNQVFLAGGPLSSGVGEGDDVLDTEGTGRTAAINKARLAADWGSSSVR